MSGQTSGIYEASKNKTSNGQVPQDANVYSFPVTLSGNAPLVVDMKTLINMNRIRNVQGIFIDNSGGTAALSVTTSAGQTISLSKGLQGIFPLFLSADGTLTFNGAAGTVNVTLTNFPVPVGTWSAT